MRTLKRIVRLSTIIMWACATTIEPASAEIRTPPAAPTTAIHSGATPGPGSLALTPCKLEGLSQPARCGSLDVPENPQIPNGRHLAIHFAVVPATAPHALPDPITPLMGGPGEDAISNAAYFAERFATLRQDRDLLLVDQRGTGQSGALHCDLSGDPVASLRDVFPLEAVKRCERELSSRADLTQYTYTHFANDLEQIRQALGYQTLNLFAASYGTRAAQVFVRAFPGSVRTLYLGSVVPIDIAIPGPFAATSQAALDTTLNACLADKDCKAAFPNLSAEFREMAARLESGEAQVLVPGSQTPATLSQGRVAEWFRSLLYRPHSAAPVPWLIHQAYLGNWQPIAEGILAYAHTADEALSFGLLFSITCSDDIPFVREEDIRAGAHASFLGNYRLHQQQAACRIWPQSTPPEGYRTAVVSDVPTLFVSGDLDGNTPLWFMEHARKGFSHFSSIVAHGQGHTEWNNCVAGAYEAMVRSGSAEGFTALACPTIKRPPFQTHERRV